MIRCCSACGALAAVDSSGTLHLSWLLLLLAGAAIAGNTVNYHIGRYVGARAFDGKHRLFKLEHLRRAEDFFRRHGGFAIALSRFVPVMRTFTPFVAGISRMPEGRFQLFNVAGGDGVGGAVPVRRVPVRQPAGGKEQFRPGDADDRRACRCCRCCG